MSVCVQVKQDLQSWLFEHAPKASVTELEAVTHTVTGALIAYRVEVKTSSHFCRLLIGKETGYPSVLVYKNNSGPVPRPIEIGDGVEGVKAALGKYFT